MPCKRPQTSKLRTNQDLAHFADAAILALERCAAQIDALRLFYDAGNDEDFLGGSEHGNN